MVDILVADDDSEIIDLLRLDLELMRFNVDFASDGLTALKKAEAKVYDLIVLDVMMPKMDGFEVTKRIRANRAAASVPIILLTAKGTIEDKIRGFNAGADDYLVKPFEFQELMVRMRALFRRTGIMSQNTTAAPKKNERSEDGDIRLLPTSLEVILKGERIKLTPTEFEIIYCLMQHTPDAVALSTILQEVWGYDADEDVRMLRVHMGGLRQKIEVDHKNPRYLLTVTNVGYRLNTTVDDTGAVSVSQSAEPQPELAIAHETVIS